MRQLFETKGLNGRQDNKTKWYFAKMRISFRPLVILLCWSMVMIGCDCNDDGVGPKPPVQEYTYTWKIDTLVFDLPGLRPPNRYSVQSIWGSSPHDVWAVSPSDVPWGELWRYDGNKWRAVRWPWNGTDEIGSHGRYLSSVTGFDSTNIFFFGAHAYQDTPSHAMVMRWNGNAWDELPWENGNRTPGYLVWGVKQNNDKLWAIGTTGIVSRYENGFLKRDSKITNYRISTPVIAALDNGKVYVNAHKDSLENEILVGTITKLYERDLSGNWLLIEDKFIEGDIDDDNGLGLGVRSIGNRLFTGNRGLWERKDTGWIKQISLYALGAWCFNTETDLWVAFKQDLFHFNGSSWDPMDMSILSSFPGYALYAQGWSDGNEVFIGFHDGVKSFVLHGKKIVKSKK